jgi:hypothetical protein
MSARPGRRARVCARLARTAALLAAIAGCSDGGTNPPPPPPPPPDDTPRIEDFRSPELCGTCHPNHFAEWSASMHAYSMTDPVFFALNAREQAATGGELGGFCVSCHSPIALVTGTAKDSGDPATLPDVVRAGVSCESCHLARKDPNTGTFFRSDGEGGHFKLVPGDSIFGPMDQVIETQFHLSIREPLFDRSDVCMPCHDLRTDAGLLEATFTEWNESSFAVRKECQDCHMEEYIGQAAAGGPTDRRLHRHYFTGVDIAMTPFPGREAQRARVEEMLANTAALNVPLPAAVAPGDTLSLSASVTNFGAGHSLPSGTTFERQMWLEVVVTDGAGDTVLISGNTDANGDLRDRHSALDPEGDTQLALWTTELTHPTDPHATVFRATGFTGEVIPAEETRMKSFRATVPETASGAVLDVSVRLLFRPFKPYVLRELGLDYLLSENPTFVMETFAGQIPLETKAGAGL